MRALSMLLALAVVSCTPPVTAPPPSPSQSSKALPSAAASPRPSLPAGGPEITEVVVARVEHQPRLPGVEAVDFLDEQTGWLGGAGAILATTDGGETWRRQYAGDQRIRRFFLLDRSRGWALGTTELLRTRNGGTSWEPLGVRDEPLVTVDFVDAARGWGIVERRREDGVPVRRLARTSDGGSTWGVTSIEAESVCFGDGQTGWLGAGRQLWRTTDGGDRWSPVFEPPVAEAVRWSATVGCVNGTNAYVQFAGAAAAMSNAAYVTYYTGDAGRSFSAVFAQGYMSSLYPTVRAPTGPGSYPPLISTTAADRATFTGWSPGPIGVAGVAAAVVHQHARIPGSAGSLLAADFVDQRHGWVVARIGAAPEAVVFATKDGGATWSPTYRGRTAVPVRAVSPIDAQRAFGFGRLGDPGAVLVTSDGGATWTSVRSAGDLTYSRGGPIASFIDADRGWLAGHLRVHATSDGGRSWSDVTLPAGAADPRGSGIGALARTGPTTGWLLANEVLYRTEDGASWTAIPIGQRLGSAASCTDEVCWVTTGYGPPVQLVRYERRTGRIDRVELAREISVHSPPNSLYADGELVRTASMTSGNQCRDFGLPMCVRMLEPSASGWREVRIPITVSFDSSLAWLDARTGWLTTGLGVYVTSDGGRSWRELP